MNRSLKSLTSIVMILSYLAGFIILAVPAMGGMDLKHYIIGVAIDLIVIICVFIKAVYSEDKETFKRILNMIVFAAVALNLLLIILVQLDLSAAAFIAIFTACPLAVPMLYIEELIPEIENWTKILTWTVPYILIGLAGNIGVVLNRREKGGIYK